MNKGFSTAQRIRSRAQFQRVYATRQRLSSRYYVLYYRVNELDYPRLGIVVSRRNVRKAVIRNRVKRLAREAFRYHQEKIGAVDLVFIAKSPTALGSKQELRQCLDKLFLQLIERHPSSFLGS